MTYKEDYFRMLEGKTPESDVLFSSMNFGPSDEIAPTVMLMSSYSTFMEQMVAGVDSWGIEYSIDVNGTGPMPTPGKFILKDARDWKKVVKAPYKYDVDFQAAAEQDTAAQVKDRDYQLVTAGVLGGSFFLQLAGFMGFEGAMLALYDQPEAVHELLDYLCDYDVWMAESFLSNYDVDVVGFADDNATEINPFFSYDMFKEFFFPRYQRLYESATKRGLPISYHNCGRCEDFMDDMVSIGTRIWNCATPVNDLNDFKARNDNKVIVEMLPRFTSGESEAEVRQRVRDYINEYAPGGGFVWNVYSLSMNPELAYLGDWIEDEIKSYGAGFYTK